MWDAQSYYYTMNSTLYVYIIPGNYADGVFPFLMIESAVKTMKQNM